MKKSLIVCCSALLALAVFADERAPSTEATAPQAPRAERGPRGPREIPLMLPVTDKTTAEEVEAFKKKVIEKIDASYADYKAKAAPEGQEKPALHLSLLVMERRPGMRGPGMRGQGPRGQGPRGPRGERGPRRGEAGEKPAPEAEAK